MKNHISKILFFIGVFAAAFLIWYSPAVFKGYAPYKMVELMPIAKNLHNTGEFSLESDKNVYLASSLIKEEGEIATVGNKFTAYLYSCLFKITGVLGPQKLVLLSIFLNALSLLIFSYIVFRLFGYALAGVFSLIYVLTPYVWFQIYSLGTYEFALFFLSLFFFFFIFGRGKKNEWLWLALSGIFLTLYALSRETFFLLILIMLVYLWFSKGKKTILPFFIPIALIILIFYLPGFWDKEKGNVYLNLFLAKEEQQDKFLDFSSYGHLYPDPYVYHFEKNEILNNYKEKIETGGLVESLQTKKILANLGERKVEIMERGIVGAYLLFGHISKFVSFEDVAGPFALFFALVGLLYLKEKDKELYKFSVYWVLGTLFLLSFAVIVSRTHMMDFSWLIPLLVSLGLIYLLGLFNLYGIKKIILSFLLVCVFSYGLLLADHFRFGKLYDIDRNLKVEAYTELINERNIADKDVVAIGASAQEETLLNYLTDKSIIFLTPQTIEKLINEDKLQEIFDYFGVKYILGYDDDLSEKIINKTGVVNISSNSIKIEKQKLSPMRLLIMNLISQVDQVDQVDAGRRLTLLIKLAVF